MYDGFGLRFQPVEIATQSGHLLFNENLVPELAGRQRRMSLLTRSVEYINIHPYG